MFRTNSTLAAKFAGVVIGGGGVVVADVVLGRMGFHMVKPPSARNPSVALATASTSSLNAYSEKFGMTSIPTSWIAAVARRVQSSTSAVHLGSIFGEDGS